jgi:hypothetical protein
VLGGFEPFGGPAADALGRRFGRHQAGMRLFERAELAQERVEFRVGQFRVVVDVIELFVAANLMLERVCAAARRFERFSGRG